ncbi:hypothetical protein SVIRM249S_06896 [Streptomyces viridochromogenes]
MAVTYTAVVDVDGEGRNGGHVSSSDGLLDTSLAIPKELGGAGGATNPEQLLAAGWAACFLGAVRRAAIERKIRLASTAITAEITLTHGDDGEFSPVRRSQPRPRRGRPGHRPAARRRRASDLPLLQGHARQRAGHHQGCRGLSGHLNAGPASPPGCGTRTPLRSACAARGEQGQRMTHPATARRDRVSSGTAAPPDGERPLEEPRCPRTPSNRLTRPTCSSGSGPRARCSGDTARPQRTSSEAEAGATRAGRNPSHVSQGGHVP